MISLLNESKFRVGNLECTTLGGAKERHIGKVLLWLDVIFKDLTLSSYGPA